MPFKDPEKAKAHQQVYFKRWYEKNKQAEIQRIGQNRRQRLKELEPVINRLKDRPCADCGRKFHPVAMDFDHVRGKKVMSVSHLMRSGASVERVMSEIKKCEVVCAVCHRIRTHLGRGGMVQRQHDGL